MKKQKLKQEALKNTKNNKTKSTYKRGIQKFCKWMKSNPYRVTIKKIQSKNSSKAKRLLANIKKLSNKKQSEYLDLNTHSKTKKYYDALYIQAYADYLSNNYYTPWTIHTYLAPICKAYGVSMKLFDKPKRTGYQKTRSRVPEKNPQGKRELKNPKFKRLVTLAYICGIRRSEYKKLKGRDLVKDENGYTCVLVQRGKGGKRQKQRVLPKNIETVRKIFENVSEDEFVFSNDEMNNHIDLHSIRGVVSFDAYLYYHKRIIEEPGYKNQLIKELCDRWLEDHPEKNQHSESYIDFVDRITNPKPYIVRGDNIETLSEKGFPIVYDRLALAAASVFHLSHWRIDITINGYFN